jgi:hypothetical protein
MWEVGILPQPLVIPVALHTNTIQCAPFEARGLWIIPSYKRLIPSFFIQILSNNSGAVQRQVVQLFVNDKLG